MDALKEQLEGKSALLGEGKSTCAGNRNIYGANSQRIIEVDNQRVLLVDGTGDQTEEQLRYIQSMIPSIIAHKKQPHSK